MSLFKRPDSPYWWCRFTVGGKRIRCSTETSSRKAAQSFEDSLRASVWQSEKLGEGTYTFEQAAIRWVEEKADKRSIDRDAQILEWFKPHLNRLPLQEIGSDLVRTLRNKRRKTVSKNTVNREFALLRAILRTARDDWEWIMAVPKVPMYPVETPEPRFLTKKQFENLANELAPHLERMARFAVNTGLRRANILRLRWNWVDFKRKIIVIPKSEFKGKRTFQVMLNPSALAVLRSVKGQDEDFVFTYEGEPIKSYKTAWNRAVKKCKLDPFRFHDLRHTWASWHVQNGTPLEVLQQLGGWQSYKMVLRYAHFAPGHLADWSKNAGTNSTREKKRKNSK